MIADWINTTFASFDYALLEFFHTLAVSASFILNPLMEFLSIIGDNGYFGFAIAIALMLFPKTRKCGAAVFLSILVGAVFTNLAIKNIVARPRPYASDVAAFKEWWTYVGAHLESEFSFPSGHTTAAMASMTALCIAVGLAVALYRPVLSFLPFLLLIVLWGIAAICFKTERRDAEKRLRAVFGEEA